MTLWGKCCEKLNSFSGSTGRLSTVSRCHRNVSALGSCLWALGPQMAASAFSEGEKAQKRKPCQRERPSESRPRAWELHTRATPFSAIQEQKLRGQPPQEPAVGPGPSWPVSFQTRKQIQPSSLAFLFLRYVVTATCMLTTVYTLQRANGNTRKWKSAKDRGNEAAGGRAMRWQARGDINEHQKWKWVFPIWQLVQGTINHLN